MKCSEISKALHLGAKILSHYKEKNIVSALEDILKVIKKNPKTERRAKSKIKKISADLTQETLLEQPREGKVVTFDLENSSLEEIKAELSNTARFPNIDSLRNFALQFGLKINNRPRSIVVQTIVKAIERTRIDAKISSRSE